ncbi:DUF1611 domain-containing protein [Allorhodopirellula heiligendammensis]|uniref:DUF1611 domain-containing protein n=1 Tax=Allorhodopirellula heiligendammensis TaxID=2714739 RepID=A0A5C6BET6_9BACT|nr:DUF1611 domain-containing protein [Allorhodopirellula heiligendammensis]TWU09806.1 hypothetical protein Poly21_54720 [Allorhodopirellula heiligendammensis]
MTSNETLKNYRRIVLLTDGHSTPFLAKTAISLLRYRHEDIAAVLDTELAGKHAQEVFATGEGIPIVDSIIPGADSIFIGIAPPGGKLPGNWRPVLKQALERGIDIVSGLHEFLGDDAELRTLANASGSQLIDVRRNTEKTTATAAPFRDGCLRIHTVGHDCSVGKMVVTLEVERELLRRNHDAQFLATGQTGIMIAGDGVPIDCVVADFVNGSAEAFVRRNEQHDFLLIEGQGSISHPSFSAVTLGLLHGTAPHGLIFCYESGREKVKGLDDVPLLPTKRLIEAYELAASLRQPCKVIGIAMNGRRLSATEAATERECVSAEFGLPVCDVYRDGTAPLADAVERLRTEMYG